MDNDPAPAPAHGPAPAAPLDPSDPYARAETFPRLPPDLIARAAAYGREEALDAGAAVFRRGDRSVDFLIVVDGAIEILDEREDGTAQVFVTHEPGTFTGEIDLLSDREILVSGRAKGASRVIRVPRRDFRRLVMGEPDIGEIVMRAFILRRVALIRHGQGGVVLIGPGGGGATLRLQQFLTRNAYPHRLLDTDGEAGADALLDGFGVPPGALPVVLVPGREALRNPSVPALADALGLTEAIPEGTVFDVAVVGAGPAGLAAAVYAASEGLGTIVVEGLAPGGQAGTSSKIENYLGFPTGISGQALAGRAQTQAQKFGARLAVSRHAIGIDCGEAPMRLDLEDGRSIRARAIVVATGARYRKLDVEGYDRFEGQGIHYAATAIEAQLCAGEEVAIVGGGNSSGQAAMFLSRFAAQVHVLCRGPGLAATMSDYLVQRIAASPRIILHPRTVVTGLEGGERLERLTWRTDGQGEARHPIRNLFVMIGAAPNTDWLGSCLDLDAKGFVLTGRDADGRALASPYATSRPGVFAVGDVRAGSVKRVASGVGEGSVVVAAVHEFLAPGAA